MATRVKRRRRYESPRRREQAEATRLAILEAAERLFVRDGYAATTMAAIAAAANVAPKTVYLAFETKSGVLRALWNLRVRGDQADAPVPERRWFREVLEEPDPERQLRFGAHGALQVKLRVGPLFDVLAGAAPIDADIAALWQRIQSEFHANLRSIVVSIAEKNALKRGLSVDRATDILWMLNNPLVWQLLVGVRGWTPEEYERWTAEVACKQLLRDQQRS